MGIKSLLLIPKLKIHNANAMSSTCTVGFPAMTAWLGAVHALERKVRTGGFPDARFSKTGVCCHACDMQLYKGPHDYRYSIIGTANPLKRKGKDFERPPFIEEARCHLLVSLVIDVEGFPREEEERFVELVASSLHRMKVAGGDIETFSLPKAEFIDTEEEKSARKILRKLMPGYAIVERRELLKTSESGKDALDSLLDILAVHYIAGEASEEDVHWEPRKKQPGWLVPLAVGFKDISGAVQAKHQRSPGYEHHFVEPLITLGEFKMPYHFRSLDEMMWEYCPDLECGLYICRNPGV